MARPSASPDLIAFPRRWAIENQWHWPRDTQHGEDDHRYSQSNGVQVLALLRTLALNLLRWKGFRSIRTGLTAEVHDISRVGVPGSGVIPPAPPTPARPGWAAHLRRLAERLALQGVGRPVTLV